MAILTIGDVYKPIGVGTIAQLMEAKTRNRIEALQLQQAEEKLSDETAVKNVMKQYYANPSSMGASVNGEYPAGLISKVGQISPTTAGQMSMANAADTQKTLSILSNQANTALKMGDDSAWHVLWGKMRELNRNLPDASTVHVIGPDKLTSVVNVTNGKGPHGQPMYNPATRQPLPNGTYKVVVKGTGQDRQILSAIPYEGTKPTAFSLYYKSQLSEGKTPDQIEKGWSDMQANQRAAYMKGYMALRPVTVIDTKNNNKPLTTNYQQLAEMNKKDPGRYLETTPGSIQTQLKQKAVLTDIQDAVSNLKQSVGSLNTPFSAAMRAKISLLMKDRNPGSALSSFLGSTEGETLTNDQMNYLADLNQVIENALALRQVMGLGQGSETIRNAILRLVPSALTPNKKYAMMQLDRFTQQINRLGRGIFNIKLANPNGEITNKGVQTSSGNKSNIPKKGDIEEGYRFLGGDPSDKNNWEKIK